MKSIAVLSAVLMLSFAPEAFAASNYSAASKKGGACVRCTVRCGQCSGSDRCINACKANGNPLVKANAACGSWYEECKK